VAGVVHLERFAQVVLLEVTLAVLVEQDAALAARRLVIRMPVPGRPVGWYWTNSMSLSGYAGPVSDGESVPGVHHGQGVIL